MKKNNLAVFSILTFAVTWTVWWLLAWAAGSGAMVYGETVFMLLFLIGGLAPTFAAFISSRISGKREGLRRYNAIAFRWRIPVVWYVLALVLLIAPRFVTIGICRILDIEHTLHFEPWVSFLPTFLMMILGGGLEEFGWRGVALPELMKKFNPALASIVLGLIWSVWHLPLFFMEGASQYESSFLFFTINTIGLTFILTWFFVHTKSVVIPLIAHAASNCVAQTLAVAGTDSVMAIDMLIKLVLGVALVGAFQIRGKRRDVSDI